MKMRWVALVVAFAFAVPSFAEEMRHPLLVLKTKAKFQDVMDDVADAITKRGLVIDTTAHIGAMLDRTAKDVGAAKKIYERAEIIQFCSAVLSRRMMEADPTNITFCPYTIAVYSLAGDPGAVYVAYRRPNIGGSPQSQAALKAVGDLLRDIVRDAVKQ